MANNFKSMIDRQVWVQIPPTQNAHAAGAGMTSDLRNDLSRNPFIYQLVSNSVLNRYNAITKAWALAVNPGLGGTFGAGAGCVFAPSFSLVGSIGAGCTTSSITTTTVLTSVGNNMLANRGGSGNYGYRIRIIGNAAGSSGKIEERWIIGNTGGTTPTILLDTPLTFTPVSGDVYEILSGKVYMLGASTLAATIFRSFEVGTNTLTSLSNTNLAATIATDFSAIALDELYVPYDCKPGEGMVHGESTYDASGIAKYCLVATAASNNSITGQASSGDASVLQNEYRNFQIRIVEDTVNTTAVGQRRIIASNTAGSSPVYSLGTNWGVTPSSNAKFVIENPNLILLRSSATTSLYTYNYSTATINNGTNSIASNAWSTTYFAAAGNAHGAGALLLPSFGIEPDAAKNSRHSYIYCFRGGGSTTLDHFDMSNGITGTWSAGIVYDGGNASFNTASCGNYAPYDQEGKFGYMNVYVASQVNQIWRFDVKNRVLTSFTPTDWIQSGTAATGNRLSTLCAIDGTDKYTLILLISHTSSIAMELLVQI